LVSTPSGWTARQWSTVCFSDESRFNLRFNDGRIIVCRRPGERYTDATIREHDRFGGGSVMVWAGITFNRRTKLYVINGNLNSHCYIDEILRPIVMSFLRRIGLRPIYQDDNARPHRGRMINDFVQQNNIVRMDWPANSPDLNPIEHIWDELGRRTYRNNPPQTLNDLRYRLVQEWQNIPQATIRCCIGSMRRRCQACINSRGIHTAYNSDIDIPLKVVKFNLDPSVLQRRCLK